MTHASSGKRILGIVADHNIEKFRQIGDRPRHRPQRAINLGPAVKHAAAADESGRWPHTDNRIPRRWTPNRCKSLLADSDRRKIRSEPRA